MTPEMQKLWQETARATTKKWLDEELSPRVELIINHKLEHMVRECLDDLIRTAKDEAVKQIAQKLLVQAISGL